jgi:hypothetical protein
MGSNPWKAIPVLLSVAYLLVTAVPLFFEFALSLQVAAALASDAVLEVVHSVHLVSPSDTEAWEAKVVGPSLVLDSGAVGQLSRGWGYGLALSYVGLWTMGIGMFAVFSMSMANLMSGPNGGRAFGAFISLVGTLLIVGLPLVMSGAVADVSTSCDDLGTAINQRRIEDLDRSPRLRALELALQNLNNMQVSAYKDRTIILKYAVHAPDFSLLIFLNGGRG